VDPAVRRVNYTMTMALLRQLILASDAVFRSVEKQRKKLIPALAISGFELPKILRSDLEHTVPLSRRKHCRKRCAQWLMTSAKERISGFRRRPYLTSRKSSAISGTLQWIGELRPRTESAGGAGVRL